MKYFSDGYGGKYHIKNDIYWFIESSSFLEMKNDGIILNGDKIVMRNRVGAEVNLFVHDDGKFYADQFAFDKMNRHDDSWGVRKNSDLAGRLKL